MNKLQDRMEHKRKHIEPRGMLADYVENEDSIDNIEQNERLSESI